MPRAAACPPCVRSSRGARVERAQELRDLADRPRLAEQIALRLVAAFDAQHVELLLGLDALGHGDHAYVGAELRHRADDGEAVFLLAELHDEGAVDLDLVEREAAQIAERGITG